MTVGLSRAVRRIIVKKGAIIASFLLMAGFGALAAAVPAGSGTAQAAVVYMDHWNSTGA